VIDTVKNTVIAKIDARVRWAFCPTTRLTDVKAWHENKSARYTGAGTFTVTLSPDGKNALRINSGSNSIP